MRRHAQLAHGADEVSRVIGFVAPVVIRPLRFRVNSCNINKAASRSAVPSACVVIAAAINPFRFSTKVWPR